jgi:hypothetical protein
MNDQTKQEIKDEYKRVQDSAWAEYLKVQEPAMAEYLKVQDSALAERDRKLKELEEDIITVEGKRYQLIK